MAEQIINVRIKQKYDLEQSWSTNNPVLLAGEVAFSSDKPGLFKVGDGESRWDGLKYAYHNNIVDLSASGDVITYTKVDGTTATIKTKDTTYNNATSTTDGLLSSTMYKKLDSIEEGANKFTLNAATAQFLGGVKSGGDISVSSAGAVTVNSASKLRNPIKIGNAIFDGTKSITLSEIGVINNIEITKAEYIKLKEAGKLDMSAYYNIIDDYDAISIINDKGAYTNQVYSSNKIEESFSKKSTITNKTLLASGWTGTKAPYTYTLPVENVTATSVNEINYNYTNNDAQIKAYQDALLRDGGQTTGQITLKATGEKPKVDIPIIIIVRNDS